MKYILGFAGGIATGKSSRCAHVVSRVRQLAAAAPRAAPRPIRCHAINVDRVGHACYEPGTPAYQQLLDCFGKERITSPSAEGGECAIDRKKLGGLVFGDPAALGRLNAIVWPAIVRTVEEEVGRLERGAAPRWPVLADGGTTMAPPRAGGAAENVGEEADTVIVIEAALLVECGLHTLCDEVWLLYVDPDVALARVTARDNTDAEAARKRIDAQPSPEERSATLGGAGIPHVVYNTSIAESVERGLRHLDADIDELWKRITAKLSGEAPVPASSCV